VTLRDLNGTHPLLSVTVQPVFREIQVQIHSEAELWRSRPGGGAAG